MLQCEEGGRRLSVVAAAGPPLFPHPLLYRDFVFVADDLDPGVDPQLVDDLVEDVPGLDDPLVLVPRGEDEVPVGEAEELVDRRVVQCRELLERFQIRLRPSLFPVRISRRAPRGGGREGLRIGLYHVCITSVQKYEKPDFTGIFDDVFFPSL